MKYTIEQFMQTTKVLGGAFSPDEESILFTTNASGIFNVYRTAVFGGGLRQLTHSTTENIYVLSYFPDGQRILVSRELAGNENFRLSVLGPEGDMQDLTPENNVTARFFGPAIDRSSFYCGANERDPHCFDIYKINFETLERELLYRDTDGYEFGCISRDERYLALCEPRTRENADIFLYDRTTSQLKCLTTHEGNACYWAACFDWDSTHLYYRTNRDSDFYYVERLELATGQTEQIVKDDCDSYFSFSPNGEYQVISRDRDSLFQIEILHVESRRRVSFPEFPNEGIAGFVFSPSAKRLGFYVKGDCRPGDLYVHDFSSQVTRKLTESLTAEIEPADLVDSEIVRYVSFDGFEIPSLLWKPHHVNPANKPPALVYLHGGPGGQTRKEYHGRVQFLVNHGYVVLAPNYRGSSGFGKTFHSLDNGKQTHEPLRDCIEAGP